MVVVEDVGGQADAALRRLDRGQHGRVGLVAVLVDLDRVAAQHGTAGQPADALLQRIEVVVATLLQAGCHGTIQAARIGAQLARAPLDAVDAEHDVADGAGDGSKPGKPDPGRGRRYLALAQERVDRDHYG